jgi:hypothetical protein
MGKFDSKSLTENKRIAFGKVTYAIGDIDKHVRICFIDSNDNETCGSSYTSREDSNHNQELPYYDYIAIALPSGPAKISYIRIINQRGAIYNMHSGLDFIVDSNTQATYFGDVTIFPQMTKAEVKDNSKATFDHLQALNPPMRNIKSYSTSLMNPLMAYRGSFTGDKFRIRFIK